MFNPLSPGFIEDAAIAIRVTAKKKHNFFFVFLFFRAEPVACGGSQARVESEL